MNGQSNYKLASNHDFNVCSACYQSYHPEQLAKSFMVCDPCKEKKKNPIKCQDKNDKFFSPGDILRSESNLLLAVRILQIQPTTILWSSIKHKDVFGCSPIKIFIDSGWIVHERVTGFEVDCNMVSNTHCNFKEANIGSYYCQGDCKHNGGLDLYQKWVICELYNKEFQDNNGEPGKEVQNPKEVEGKLQWNEVP